MKTYSMETYCMGMMAKSLAGHDRGKTYMILSADETFAYLADGSIRTMQNPKKKKLKHMQVDRNVSAWIENILADGKKVYDSDIIKAIKDYKNNAAL